LSGKAQVCRGVDGKGHRSGVGRSEDVFRKIQRGFSNQERPERHPTENGNRIGFDHNGFDRVEFLIAPNPGEGLKPLVKIASGGETSRLMLGLKNVLARADEVPSLIFDEIDQGIGGRVGMTVGQKLWNFSRSHQVFCVTHLPQLAVFGDEHYQVQKLSKATAR
jgi:DNA repair protein RecN (Recombination protein N)